MSWGNIEQEIIRDSKKFGIQIKELAPQNSTYISYDKGKLVDYIYVEGKRVRTNSNRLYENIYQTIQYTDKRNMLFQTVVNKSRVPYYNEAVLSKTRTVAYHYLRSEYGKLRYSKSIERVKENKNYMYYMKGIAFMESLINKWNGKVFTISNDIGEFV